MVKKIIKYFTITFIISMLFTTNIFASTTDNDTVTFPRKYVTMNKLFTVTFNKALVAKVGVQTIQDIEKLITCTEDDNGKTIPIRASYQVDSTNNTTKLNVQISDENGQPSGQLGEDYTLTINKGIKAIDGTVTDKTYVQPFTINAPEPVDDNVRLMISKDQWNTHAKGYYSQDWLMTYPYCSQILMNDGTMLKNVSIKYANGHVSGDVVEDNDVADGGKSTVLSKEGTYVYYGYPMINGVEDNKRLFQFTFNISNNASTQHVDNKIIMGSSYLPSMLDMEPEMINVLQVNGMTESMSVIWDNDSQDLSGKILEDNMIYENTGHLYMGNLAPITYYYVANPPDDNAEFAKITKGLSQDQINYLKNIQSIMGESHWNYSSSGFALYVKNINKDSIYKPWMIGFGTAFNEKTDKPYIYVCNTNNILGNIDFSDFQKVRNDVLGLLDKNTMAPALNNITELDSQIQNSMYPLSNLTNTMLEKKQFSWIFGYQKQINGITIKATANTTNGKIESNYYLNNGK